MSAQDTTERKEFPATETGVIMLISEYEERFKKACKTGWGCGYVTIPKNHPAYELALLEQKKQGDHWSYYFQPDFSEEITLCEFKEEGLFIGFDSAHRWNGPQNDREWVLQKTKEMAEAVDKIGRLALIKEQLRAMKEAHKEMGLLIKNVENQLQRL